MEGFSRLMSRTLMRKRMGNRARRLNMFCFKPRLVIYSSLKIPSLRRYMYSLTGPCSFLKIDSSYQASSDYKTHENLPERYPFHLYRLFMLVSRDGPIAVFGNKCKRIGDILYDTTSSKAGCPANASGRGQAIEKRTPNSLE